MTKFRVICIGGTGYIGSITAVHLIDHGYDVAIIDDFSNSTEAVAGRIRTLAGASKVDVREIDCCNYDLVLKAFEELKPDAVIHFAAMKKVGESVEQPLKYYDRNLQMVIQVLKAMTVVGCKTIVFSSSATVYTPTERAVTETDTIGASNPYGHSKVISEQILRDVFTSDKTWKISMLRYFNPVGAHSSALLGESPDVPACVLPVIQQVAIGRIPELRVFGKDWDTPDGTGVRDYIDINDLAAGHSVALEELRNVKEGCVKVYNLGYSSNIIPLLVYERTSEVAQIHTRPITERNIPFRNNYISMPKA
eukprot:GHVO01040334.1.p1 GENE.GHVO01040334.1~~GHVO01040334.1.p1  ORF type:complete len:320 (+),score=65.35 GHVO01040334.1:39-962(+)